MGAPIDLTGMQFGRLLVVEKAESIGRERMWLCRCACGAEVRVRTAGLRGGTKSCGCLRRDTTSARCKTHGMTDSRTYATWRGMVDRCGNERHIGWKRYGGRGIAVCEQWRTFAGFIADMGDRPEGMTLDRIDSTRGYEPGNCRWATSNQQARHRRSLTQEQADDIRSLRVSGLTTTQLSKLFGVADSTVWHICQGNSYRKDCR